MPKIRRKNKSKRAKTISKRTKDEHEDDSLPLNLSCDKPRTDFDPDSFNQSNPICSLPNLGHTPSPEISLPIFPGEKECSLETTPKNSRRNLTTRYSHRLDVDAVFNLSTPFGVSPTSVHCSKRNKGDNNINSINYVNIGCSEHDVIPKGVIHHVKSLKSSAMKKSDDIIFETPKLIPHEHSNHARYEQNDVQNNVIEMRHLGRSKSENEILRLVGMVNINPYLNYQNMQIKSSRENTVNELSFFTPELLKTKPASTPIQFDERKLPRKPLNDITNENQIGHTKKNSKNSITRRPSLTPLIDQKKLPNIHKFERNYLRSKKISRVLSRTAPTGKLKSPKKIVNYTKDLHGLRSNYMSCSYKSLVDESTTGNDTLGILRKLLNGIHKYGVATAKWTMSLFSICIRLGNSLKMGITTLCAYCRTDDAPKETCLHCSQYQEEVQKLNSKINDLSTNLINLRSEVLENIQNTHKVDVLTNNLEEMSKKIETLTSLKTELDNLKLQFNNSNTPAISRVLPTLTNIQAAVAPPPPPPPPPPPLPPLHLDKAISIVKNNSSKTKLKTETPRPMITLDDILKVKLKKTSERTVNPRRMANKAPEVALETLQHVTRRKSISRPMTPSSLPEISSEGSTSPHSSLKRLLREDSGFRIKRLRRVGGYSFDDVNKKNLIGKLNRERE